MRFDRHHILFTRKNYNKGYAHLLRRAFVYEIPMNIHQDLHATIGPVPPISEAEAEWLWKEYKKTNREMGLYEALAWLQLHAPNSEFAIAVMSQAGFLRNRGVL